MYVYISTVNSSLLSTLKQYLDNYVLIKTFLDIPFSIQDSKIPLSLNSQIYITKQEEAKTAIEGKVLKEEMTDFENLYGEIAQNKEIYRYLKEKQELSLMVTVLMPVGFTLLLFFIIDLCSSN